ncbi:DUF3870 domain-containing protein [Brevibacillus fluminis]|uniref:DUF3870 domain-containing protein n=1 Tax=Brevibacillus fluminis TaxID=511487 RepID=A0A3M8DJP3_9BACL|nr:DUF3870 domain-containing protein [Brevibacillus fluminis]RNB87671.1 DUF3870 domain-containing protein [Brevibacillus fluminis]
MEVLQTVLVTGYSKAPQGTSMYEVYKHAGIVLEVHMETHRIVGVEFTFVAGLTKDFFERLVVGYELDKGLEPLIKRIQDHYFAPSQQAIIVALQSAVQRYWDFLDKKK